MFFSHRKRLIEVTKIYMKSRSKYFDIATMLIVVLNVASNVIAEENPSQQISAPEDCTMFAIDNIDHNSLTDKEKIALLDSALIDSAERFDICAQSVASQGGGAGGSSGGGEAGGGAGGGGVGEAGDAASETDKKSLEQQQTESIEENEGKSSLEKSNQKTENVQEQSGSTPKDIPSADNDSVLQKQIREAALKEKDPVKQKKLWDLYRKYKKEN